MPTTKLYRYVRLSTRGRDVAFYFALSTSHMLLGASVGRAQDLSGGQQTAAPHGFEDNKGDGASEKAAVREARKVVARAQALFDARDFGAALVEFQRAYTLLDGDSRQSAALYNTGVCYERLFRYDLALEVYARLRADAGLDSALHADLEQSMRTLGTLLGSVFVGTNAKAEVWVDGHALGTVPRKLILSSGPHSLELHARGFEVAKREINIAAGTEQKLQLRLEPMPRYDGVRSEYFWVGSGLTVAALSVGLTLGTSAARAHASDQRAAQRGLRPDGHAAKERALGADIAFGTAFVFGVSSIVLYFLTDFQGESPSATTAPLRVLPVATNTSLAAFVQGTLP